MILGIAFDDLNSLLNDMIRYTMFPILLVETMVYLPMNGYLIWLWFTTGQWDSIVNKLITIQTLSGIMLTIGRLVDFYLRLHAWHPSVMKPSTYCGCWLVFYRFLTFIFQSSHLSMALVRWNCVRHPLTFHIRYATQNGRKDIIVFHKVS